MRPAYHISLTAPEKRMVAELALIQSQIDWLMQLTVAAVLDVSHSAARSIMGSTSLAANAEIWLAAVREKHPFAEEILPWAEYVFGEMAAMAKGRNDFLHTLYGVVDKPGEPANLAFSWGHVGGRDERGEERGAVRVKNAAAVSIADLRLTRDRAAYLSVAVAHIEWTATDPLDDNGASPWLRRLGGPLPPPRGEAGFRKATKRQSPPRSSEG